MSARPLPGGVGAAHGRHYIVDTEGEGLLHCLPRGKQSRFACGDELLIAPLSAGQGSIVAALPRATLLIRSAPHRAKLIAANATQVAVVVAGEPSFSDELIARILVAAAHQRMSGLLLLNKCDLVDATAAARERLAPFRDAGYPVIELSAYHDVGPVKALLADQTTVLLGQSGMGKSTLVNALIPGIEAATQEISRFLDSGRHTTSAARLYGLADANLIDCPGLQEFGLSHLSSAEIERGFVELAPYLGGCRFRDCRHQSEPECAVRDAVAHGAIHPRRLELLHRIQQSEGAR